MQTQGTQDRREFLRNLGAGFAGLLAVTAGCKEDTSKKNESGSAVAIDAPAVVEGKPAVKMMEYEDVKKKTDALTEQDGLVEGPRNGFDSVVGYHIEGDTVYIHYGDFQIGFKKGDTVQMALKEDVYIKNGNKLEFSGARYFPSNVYNSAENYLLSRRLKVELPTLLSKLLEAHDVEGFKDGMYRNVAPKKKEVK